MLLNIDFVCSFCKESVTSKSINDEHMAVCLHKGDWTNDLIANIEGPHICMTCIETIIEAKKDMTVSPSIIRR